MIATFWLFFCPLPAYQIFEMIPYRPYDSFFIVSGRKSIPVLDWWRNQRRSSSATGNEVSVYTSTSNHLNKSFSARQILCLLELKHRLTRFCPCGAHISLVIFYQSNTDPLFTQRPTFYPPPQGGGIGVTCGRCLGDAGGALRGGPCHAPQPTQRGSRSGGYGCCLFFFFLLIFAQQQWQG